MKIGIMCYEVLYCIAADEMNVLLYLRTGWVRNVPNFSDFNGYEEKRASK